MMVALIIVETVKERIALIMANVLHTVPNSNQNY